LYYFTIFFIPFSATSLLNSASGAPLLATQYLGALLILRKSLEVVLARRISVPAKFADDRSFSLILLFTAVVLATMVMPAIIDGRMLISTMKLPDLEEAPLRLSSENVKNPLPVMFGMLLAYVITTRNSTPQRILVTLRAYLGSLTFVSLWGMLEILFFSHGIQFPYFVFNSSVHNSVIGIGTTTNIGEGDFLRVASVTLEPSLFSQVLLSGVPIYLLAWAGNVAIYTKTVDRAMLACIIVGLLIATSASAYLGLLVIGGVFLGVGHFTGLIRVRNYVLGAVVLLSLGYLAYELIPAINDYIAGVILDKQNTGSAFERVYSVAAAWGYFLDYPVLGVGWATVTSHDLFVCLLANSGIVGLASFMALVVYVASRSMKLVKSLRSEIGAPAMPLIVLSCGVTISFIAHLGISSITEFTYYLPHFYFLLGMVIATNICMNKHLSRSRSAAA
jgi:hypothetical protein